MLQKVAAPEPDKILRLMAQFAADPRPQKIDLGVGVYRDVDGNTPVMRAVKAAEQKIWDEQTTKGYVGLSGDPAFHAAIHALVFGQTVSTDRVATLATPGGTGAVRQAMELVVWAKPKARVWLPEPSWPNHAAIVETLQLEQATYRHYDPKTGLLHRAGMMEDLEAGLSSDDVLLLHGCCHNPTGVDLDQNDWRALADLAAARGALVMLDLAYQGFGDGLMQDVAGLRLLSERVPELIVCVSGSKNFGLYRDRVGAVLAVCPSPATRAAVYDTLAWINRQSYCFPPDHGARVVTEILTVPELRTAWETELDEMRIRVQTMRQNLVQALCAETGSDSFAFLAEHRGMFSLIGARPEQVTALRDDHALYIVGDGRINVAGLTPDTIHPTARAIATVLG